VVAADGDRGAQALVGVARRHPHIHHGGIGPVRVHRSQQVLGGADGGDHLVAAVSQDLGQARPDHCRVLSDHNPHRVLPFSYACADSSTVTTVGPPGGLLTCSVPSTVLTRPATPARPPRRRGGRRRSHRR
jgi:hypothetical protein